MDESRPILRCCSRPPMRPCPQGFGAARTPGVVLAALSPPPPSEYSERSDRADRADRSDDAPDRDVDRPYAGVPCAEFGVV